MELKRVLIIAVIMTVAAGAGFAQVTAVVEQASGKVEVRPDGASGWEPVEEGAEIERGTTLSTGFNSEARLRIAESVIEVEALTRMTLEELVEDADSVSTDVFVGVGRTNSSVESAEGVENDFEMRSPNTTASVRGTEFSFDTRRTDVTDGTVTVANFLGRSTSVPEGGSAQVQEFGSMEDVRQTFLGDSSVDTRPGEDEDSGGGGRKQASTATVVITINWD
ncbi:MAG: hypothetical protein ACLFUX_07970 [Spirochaetaceae bacterium]